MTGLARELNGLSVIDIVLDILCRIGISLCPVRLSQAINNKAVRDQPCVSSVAVETLEWARVGAVGRLGLRIRIQIEALGRASEPETALAFRPSQHCGLIANDCHDRCNLALHLSHVALIRDGAVVGGEG